MVLLDRSIGTRLCGSKRLPVLCFRVVNSANFGAGNLLLGPPWCPGGQCASQSSPSGDLPVSSDDLPQFATPCAAQVAWRGQQDGGWASYASAYANEHTSEQMSTSNEWPLNSNRTLTREKGPRQRKGSEAKDPKGNKSKPKMHMDPKRYSYGTRGAWLLATLGLWGPSNS